MKIAVVCPYDIGKPGGVQDQAVHLVEWLQEAGHHAWLVAPGEGGPPGTISVGAAANVPINQSVAPVAIDIDVPKAVVSAVTDADVVHIHEPFVPLVGAAALLGVTPPKVVTFHADPSSIVRGLYRVGSVLLRRWAKRAAVVTAVSPVAAAAVAPFAEARIIPNGIDTAAFSGGGQRTPGLVAFLGRDDPRKGLDVLLAAWPTVKSAVPGAELHVMGANRPDGGPGIVYLGRVPETLKRRELLSAAVFCAPNTGGESFGIVLVEAMAAGCAVVASDLESFAYVLGDAGMLVPVDDAGALADTLVMLLTSPDVASDLGARSIGRAREFDRAGVLDAYLQAYREATLRKA